LNEAMIIPELMDFVKYDEKRKREKGR
jgi:hypothetical protein